MFPGKNWLRTLSESHSAPLATVSAITAPSKNNQQGTVFHLNLAWW